MRILLLITLTATVALVVWLRSTPDESRETVFRRKPSTASQEVESSAALEISTPDGRQRETLSDWASTEPDAAAEWVMTLPPGERLGAATDVLIALGDRPDEAVRAARYFCARDPSFVREHGSTLVTVLIANGGFGGALHFAENGGPERAQWIAHAFERWTEQQPEGAARAALAQVEGDGFPTVSATWSARDPAAFAEFAWGIEDPAQRATALADAVRGWMERDPDAAAGWIKRLPGRNRFVATEQRAAVH